MKQARFSLKHEKEARRVLLNTFDGLFYSALYALQYRLLEQMIEQIQNLKALSVLRQHLT